MKIVFIDPLKFFGGQKRFCIELAQEIHNRGHEVYFVTDRSSTSLKRLKESLPVEKIITCRFENRLSFQTFRSIKRILLSKHADIAFFNGDRSSFYGKFVAFQNKNHFISIHCMHLFIEDVTVRYPLWKQKLYNTAFKIQLNAFDLTIPVNPANALKLESYGVSKEKIHPILNGVSYQAPDIGLLEIKKVLGLGDDTVIGFVGRLDHQKGVNFLIEAFSKLKLLDNLKLVIIGEGDLKKDLQLQAVQLGINDNVIFAGFKSDIHNYYQLFEVLVVPSLYEGFSLTVIEAMSQKCCIVATDIPGNTVALQHQYNALLVPPKNSVLLSQEIKKVLGSQDLRLRLSKQAEKNFIEKYQWENVVDTYLKTFEQIFQESSRI